MNEKETSPIFSYSQKKSEKSSINIIFDVFFSFCKEEGGIGNIMTNGFFFNEYLKNKMIEF